MTSSENLEPWNFMPTFADSWLSEAFARDTDTLTRALQKSLSDYSDFVTGDDAFSTVLNMVKPESTSSLQTPSVSGSDPETSAAKRRNGVSNGKNNETEVACVEAVYDDFYNCGSSQFSSNGSAGDRGQLRLWTASRFCRLETGTSAGVQPVPRVLAYARHVSFLLEHHQQVTGPTSTANTQPGMGYTPPGSVAEGGAGFDFDSFSGFPTLESWKVM